MNMMRGWLWVLCGWWLITAAHAGVRLDNSGEFFPVASSLQYFVDESRQLTIRDLLDQPDRHVWDTNQDEVFNLGYQRGAAWLRLEIRNDSLRDDWVLAIESPLLRRLDVFFVRDGALQEVYQTGDRFEFAARPLAHRNFLFPLQLPSRQSVTLYIRAESPSSLVFPMHIHSTRCYIQFDNRMTWFYGLLCGFVLVMSLYNFFVFTATRDMSYLYYSLFSVGLNFYLLSVQGFGYQYLWPENIYWQHKSIALSISSSLLFGSLFVCAFLRLRESMPRLAQGFNAVAVAALVLMVASLSLDEFSVIQASVYLTMVSCLLALIAGFALWLKGRYEARFFVLGWCVFLGAAALFAAASLGYIRYSLEIRYALEAGVVVQLVLLAFALADRINHERQLRQALEEQSRHYQRQHLLAKERALEREVFLKEELERRVNERTIELNEAMDKLKTAHHRLERINQLDEVTGLNNQNYFFDVLKREWERALRDQRCISLIVIELDDFSLIGERHGEIVQEECLKLVAGMLRDAFSRPADALARYGDKVFGVLLPETELHGARQLAMGLCEQISAAPQDFGLCRLMLTLSVGVASGVPVAGQGCMDMLETAESALYVAHNNGGNQVQTAAVST